MFGISGEEHTLAQRFIVADSAKKVLERDISKVDQTDLKLSLVYKEMMVRLSDQVSLDLRGIKQKMTRIGLRVSETKPGEHEIHRGGHEARSHLDRIVLKNLVTEYLLNLLEK